MANKYALLRMIDYSKNHQKEYEMIQIDANQFEAKYGRIGASKQTKIYSMSKWNEIYDQKVRKGYVDVTASVPTPTFNKTENITPLAPKVNKVKVNDELLDIANNISGCKVEDIDENTIDDSKKYLLEARALSERESFLDKYSKFRSILSKNEQIQDIPMSILLRSMEKDLDIYTCLINGNSSLENPNLTKEEKQQIKNKVFREMRRIAIEYAA